MVKEELEAEYRRCLNNPNFQFYSLVHPDPSDPTKVDDSQFIEKGRVPWKRLSQQSRNLVVKEWLRYTGHDFMLYGEMSEEQQWEVAVKNIVKYRFLCQTNLFFLCKILEKYNQLSDRVYILNSGPQADKQKHTVHEEICNAFFVRKNPVGYHSFEGFANAYTKHPYTPQGWHLFGQTKERLLLVPRGGFKSSINMADCIQWFICFPEVTVAILTGKLDLAKDFVGEIKAHCTLEKNFAYDEHEDTEPELLPRQLRNRLTGEESSSVFQVLFREHCRGPKEGNAFEFQTPACKAGDKEPTIRATSIEQELAGSHFCVLKLDDVVTEENSLTVTRMLALNKRVSVDQALLQTFGFYDVVGTWYDERDYYGRLIAYDTKCDEDATLARTTKIYRRAVWWPTDAAMAAGKTEAEWQNDDATMWFPERLPFEEMKAKAIQDPEGFAIKYLNDPRQIHKLRFPRELLIRRTIPYSVLPPQGFIATVVDCAYSVRGNADYTVILTGLIFGGRFYVLNMKRGRFNEYELPKMIADVGYVWKPKQIVIEESVGVKWMGRELGREMDKLKIAIPVRYATLGKGVAHRKTKMARPVLRLLGDERLFFANACEGLDEIYNELGQFTGTPDDTHDDIVDALALLVNEFAAYVDTERRVNNAVTDYTSSRQEYELHQMVHCLGKYAKYNTESAANPVNDDNPTTAYQVQEALSQAPDATAGGEFDPLGDLMS